MAREWASRRSFVISGRGLQVSQWGDFCDQWAWHIEWQPNKDFCDQFLRWAWHNYFTEVGVAHE